VRCVGPVPIPAGPWGALAVGNQFLCQLPLWFYKKTGKTHYSKRKPASTTQGPTLRRLIPYQ
jgi:hypothetical protein